VLGGLTAGLEVVKRIFKFDLSRADAGVALRGLTDAEANLEPTEEFGAKCANWSSWARRRARAPSRGHRADGKRFWAYSTE
jgi:hypothetical protein